MSLFNKTCCLFEAVSYLIKNLLIIALHSYIVLQYCRNFSQVIFCLVQGFLLETNFVVDESQMVWKLIYSDINGEKKRIFLRRWSKVGSSLCILSPVNWCVTASNSHLLLGLLNCFNLKFNSIYASNVFYIINFTFTQKNMLCK